MVVASIFAFGIVLLVVIHVIDDPVYRRAAPIAFLFHLAIGLLVVPAVPYHWDIGTFHLSALELMGGQVPDGSTKVIAFASFQALLYTVFKPSVDVIVVSNSFFATLVPIPAGYLARRLYPRSSSTNLVTLCVLFLPLPALYLSIPMRDAVTVFLIFSILAFLVLGWFDQSFWAGIGAILLLAVLFPLRTEFFLVIILGVAVVLGIRSVRRSRGVSLDTTTGVAALTLVATGWLLFTQMVSVETLNNLLSSRTSDGAAYLQNVTYESWLDVLLAVPVRMIYFQFTPFPLHVKSIFHFFAALYGTFVIVLFVSALRSTRRCETNFMPLLLLVTVYVAGIGGYGVVSGNFGTTTRHRIPFDFLLVVFATPVLERWEDSLRRWIRNRASESTDYDKQKKKTHEIDRPSR